MWHAAAHSRARHALAGVEGVELPGKISLQGRRAAVVQVVHLLWVRRQVVQLIEIGGFEIPIHVGVCEFKVGLESQPKIKWGVNLLILGFEMCFAPSTWKVGCWDATHVANQSSGAILKRGHDFINSELPARLSEGVLMRMPAPRYGSTTASA